MNTAVVVTYETKDANQATVNQGLIEKVFAELNAERPAGLRYASFRLAGGTRFVHVAVVAEGTDALADSAAFAIFQDGLGERLATPVDVARATVVGSYGW